MHIKVFRRHYTLRNKNERERVLQRKYNTRDLLKSNPFGVFMPRQDCTSAINFKNDNMLDKAHPDFDYRHVCVMPAACHLTPDRVRYPITLAVGLCCIALREGS
jgi:hypothetical protein